MLLLRWYFFSSKISVFNFLVLKHTDPYVIDAGIICRKLKACRQDENVTEIMFSGQWNQRIPTLKTKISLETTTFIQICEGMEAFHSAVLINT